MFEKLREPIDIIDIDFRVQSVGNGYCILLAYKNARIDMQRLDEVVGAENWQRSHTRDNKNCIISIWDDKKKQWISKEDTGVESYSDSEKGLASDSFKRAGFNWGIGRELYEMPFIYIKLKPDEFESYTDRNGKTKYKLTNKFRPDNIVWEYKYKKHNIFLKATLNGVVRYSTFNKQQQQKEVAESKITLNSIKQLGRKDISKAKKLNLEFAINNVNELEESQYANYYNQLKELIK